MRAVVQRVHRASVEVGGEVVGAIGPGLVAFLGVGKGDAPEDAEYMAAKLVGLRVFPDETGRMARSLLDVAGELLVVSQFTLYGDVRRGLRPGFDAAREPAAAEALCEAVIALARARGARVATGRFRAMMRVEVDNDGPVTILVDSKRLF